MNRSSIRYILFPIMSLVYLTLTGCVTYTSGYGQRATEQREDVLLLREENQRLVGRIEGLEIEAQRMQRELDAQRNELQRTQSQDVSTKLVELDQRIVALQQAREKDRQELVDRLTKTIEQLMKSQTTARPANTSTRAATTTGYGYEHVVGAGETLSQIAAAYSVRAKTIIDANHLKNPDQLRVGQKLFIPE